MWEATPTRSEAQGEEVHFWSLGLGSPAGLLGHPAGAAATEKTVPAADETF